MLQPLWRTLTPRLLEDVPQATLVNISEVNPQPEMASPTAGVSEGPRFSFDQHLPLIGADGDQKRNTILIEARQKPAPNPKRRTASGGVFLNARE